MAQNISIDEYNALLKKPAKAKRGGKSKRKKPQIVPPNERVTATPLADCAAAVAFARKHLKLPARDAVKIGLIWYVFLTDEPDAVWTTIEARLQKHGYFMQWYGWARDGGHYVGFTAWSEHYASRGTQ